MREMQSGKPGWKAVFTIVERRNDPNKKYWMRIGTPNTTLGQNETLASMAVTTKLTASWPAAVAKR